MVEVKNLIKNILAYPIFWIVVIFIVMFPTLFFDLYDDHAWRQSITMIITKNLVEYGFQIFYPLYDICGEFSPDYLGTEFPIMNIITTLSFILFSEDVFFARLTNWIISLCGMFFFYKTVHRILLPQGALIAMFFLAGSAYTMFARKYMPDTFSLSLVIIGVSLWWGYLERGQWKLFVFGFVLVLLGMLSKVPSLTYITVLLMPFIDKKISFKKKGLVAIGTLICVIVTGYWYLEWVPHLDEISSCSFLMFPYSLQDGWAIVSKNLDQVAYRFYDNAFLSRPAFVLVILGIIWGVIKREKLLLTLLIFYLFVFSIFILKSGEVFHTHTYYVIPCIPIMAVFIGLFFQEIKASTFWKYLICAGFLIIPGHKIFIDVTANYDAHFAELKEVCRQSGIEEDELVMINSGALNPTLHYFADKKGWAVNNDVIHEYGWYKDFKNQGLKYIIIDKTKLDPSSIQHKLIYEGTSYNVYLPRSKDEMSQMDIK